MVFEGWELMSTQMMSSQKLQASERPGVTDCLEAKEYGDYSDAENLARITKPVAPSAHLGAQFPQFPFSYILLSFINQAGLASQEVPKGGTNYADRTC